MKLETNRLIIRNWQENDIDDLIEGLNDFNVSKWLALVPFPYSKEKADDWIKYCIKNETENNHLQKKSGFHLKS